MHITTEPLNVLSAARASSLLTAREAPEYLGGSIQRKPRAVFIDPINSNPFVIVAPDNLSDLAGYSLHTYHHTSSSGTDKLRARVSAQVFWESIE